MHILLFTVTVVDFKLESRVGGSGRCYDYLEINGKKYCASELSSNGRLTYVSATGSLNFEFHTDGGIQAKGFLLEYNYGYYRKFQMPLQLNYMS